jgi:GNAT superfamily N-acetyltransferase
MSSAAVDPADGLGAPSARRWREADPLLPVPGFTHGLVPGSVSAHCGAELVVPWRGGGVLAAARCEHWAGAPGSLDLSWGAASRFQLTALVADYEVAAGLDRLLTLWRDHLADVHAAGDEDTAAVVNWPSRDADGVAALLRHGLAPLEVLAARTPPRRGPAGLSPIPNGAGLLPGSPLLIRRAGPADNETVARLALEIIRWDSRFGTVHERPDTLSALRREVAGLLAGPDPWTWLAEADGRAVGMLSAQRPPAAGWITPMAGRAPAAYLMLMFVEPDARGAGVGAALVERFHRAADEEGMAVTLLHYELLNPLSAPFWNRHGYRPLWTTWQAVPASAIR